MSHHLSFLLILSSVTANDVAVMLKLANSLNPLPSGWSNVSSKGFCTNWIGVQCDTSGKESSINLSGTLPSELSKLTLRIYWRYGIGCNERQVFLTDDAINECTSHILASTSNNLAYPFIVPYQFVNETSHQFRRLYPDLLNKSIVKHYMS